MVLSLLWFDGTDARGGHVACGESALRAEAVAIGVEPRAWLPPAGMHRPHLVHPCLVRRSRRSTAQPPGSRQRDHLGALLLRHRHSPAYERVVMGCRCEERHQAGTAGAVCSDIRSTAGRVCYTGAEREDRGCRKLKAFIFFCV